jgi:hypothetical protein
MSRHSLPVSGRAPDPHAPPPLSASTRRSAFGQMGAALLLVAPAAGDAKAAELDGELLALCGEYVAMQRDERACVAAMTLDESRAFHAASTSAMFRDEPAPDELLLQRIGRLPARTPEGVRAKARVLVWFYGGNDDRMPHAFRQDRVLVSLLGDLAGRAGA